MPTAKTECRTDWVALIQTYPDATDRGRKGVSVSCRGDSLELLISDIYRHATYYHGCGYRVRAEGIRQQCKECSGDGKTLKWSKRLGYHNVECKECRKQPVRGTLDDIDLFPSPCVKMEVQPYIDSYDKPHVYGE